MKTGGILLLILAILVTFSCKEEGVLDSEIHQDQRDSSTIRMALELSNLYSNLTGEKSNYKNKSRSILFKELSQQKTGIEALTFDLRSEYELMLAGETRKAIKGFYRIDSVARSMGIAENQAVYRMTKEFRAVANLRLGEQENCLINHNEQSCLLPFQEKSFHIKKEGSSTAIQIIEDLLAVKPDLNFQWILNIAYMTLGQYPDQVPGQFLIPLERDEKQLLTQGRFTNVADMIGVGDNRLSGGVIIEDFDRDEDLDIMVSSWALKDQVYYFENDGKGSFSNKYKETGIEGITGGLNMTHGDYNNDGYADVFITRGAWLRNGLFPNSLLRNNGDGTFTDITVESGIYSLHPTQTSVWADFNNDGWVDIFVGNETYQFGDHPCELWLNDGAGKFINIASKVGADITSFIKGVASSDYDNDGDQDLFLSNMSGDNFLLRNDKSENPYGFAFTEVTKEAGVVNPQASFPCWFFDINNDGWEDLYVSGFPFGSYGQFAAEYAREMMGIENSIEKPRVYINNQKGGFEDMTIQYNQNTTCYTMGSNYGDINNDGYLDFYLGTGEPDLKALVPNRMFLNMEGETFEEVTAQGGFGHVQKGHAISFADINNDGHQDVYAVMGGAYEGDDAFNALFLNPGNENNWVKIELEGVESNRMAFGAKLIFNLSGEKGKRKIYRTISSGSSFGENPVMVHVGFNKNEKIDNINIIWPGGMIQKVTSIEPKTKYRIREGEDPTRVDNLKSIELKLNKKHVHNH